MDETLTVLKLNLPKSLVRSLATTNAIENLMETVRRVTRNVKRWRNKNQMVKRWTTLAISTAQRKFRRIKGYRDMPTLTNAIHKAKEVDTQVAAA